MGQTMGRMPDTWDELMEEQHRVLQWSGEVLAKVDDNISGEDTFLMDYDNEKIDAKVEKWMGDNRPRIDVALGKFPNASDECKNRLTGGIEKVKEDIKAKMRKEYQNAYSDNKKFTKRVDQLGVEERKIHGEIQQLESDCAGDVKKFQKKFGPLRVKVFNNLRTGEKMIFEEKKLKTDFTKRIDDIDRKNTSECTKKIDKLIKEFEKCAGK